MVDKYKEDELAEYSDDAKRFVKQERRWQRLKQSQKPTEGAGNLHRIPSPGLQGSLIRIWINAVIILFAAIMAQVDSSLPTTSRSYLAPGDYCFACGKVGHWRRNCPDFKPKDSQSQQ